MDEYRLKEISEGHDNMWAKIRELETHIDAQNNKLEALDNDVVHTNSNFYTMLKMDVLIMCFKMEFLYDYFQVQNTGQHICGGTHDYINRAQRRADSIINAGREGNTEPNTRRNPSSN